METGFCDCLKNFKHLQKPAWKQAGFKFLNCSFENKKHKQEVCMGNHQLEKEKYLSDFDYLAEDVYQRKKQKMDIRKKIDVFAKNHFGIENYSALMNSELGESDELKISVCCQVTTANIEHVSAQFFAEWLNNLGLPAVACFTSFVEDSFAYANEYKKSLVKIPWLKKSKKSGKLFAENEAVVPKACGDIGGWILEKIQTKEGLSLPDFHRNIIKTVVTKKYLSVDTSRLFEKCLREAIINQGKMPEYFYVLNGNKDEKVKSINGLNSEKVRPPASWFYYLHLLAFLDGERALVTQVNDCRKIEKCFSDSISLIKEKIGVEPLIIYTPENVIVDGYKSNLYEINGALSRWNSNDSIKPKSKNLFCAMREIEGELIAFN